MEKEKYLVECLLKAIVEIIDSSFNVENAASAVKRILDSKDDKRQQG